MASDPPHPDTDVLGSVQRPHPLLLIKYLIPAFFVVVGVGVAVALWAAGIIPRVGWQVLFVVVPMILAPLGAIIRYYTLSYQIDDAGIRMAVGLLNRRESYVTFARVQDIHLDRSLIDRWMGLGTISIQTASGQSAAEVRLFGLRDSEAIRDALYRRLRRQHGYAEAGAAGAPPAEAASSGAEAPSPGASPAPSVGGAPAEPYPAAARNRAAEVSRLLRELTEETRRLADAVAQLDSARAIQERRAAVLRAALPPQPEGEGGSPAPDAPAGPAPEDPR